MAVASAVCGLTAIVPFVSQIAGLILGVASLGRIRRARRRGVRLGGRGWAVAGIVTSGFVLLCWLVAGVALMAVGQVFSDTTDLMRHIRPPQG
jgi:hypothetical protein